MNLTTGETTPHVSARRAALSLVEVLLALAVLAVLGVAVLAMTGQSVEALRVDRVRAAAEELCRSTVERFGTGEDNVQAHLAPLADQPGTLAADDLWERIPEVYRAMGFTRLAELKTRNGLAMRVCLRGGVEPGLDVLTCDVSWRDDRGASRPPEHVKYTRFILRDHVH